jgi:hypothetical protein
MKDLVKKFALKKSSKKNASTNDKGTRSLTIKKIRFSSNPSPMGNPKEISPCLKEPQNLLCPTKTNKTMRKVINKNWKKNSLSFCLSPCSSSHVVYQKMMSKAKQKDNNFESIF